MSWSKLSFTSILLWSVSSPGSAQTPAQANSPLEPNTSGVVTPVCRSKKADAVLTVERRSDGVYSGSARSGRSYHLNDCQLYVVDVTLPSDFRFETSAATPKAIAIEAGLANGQAILKESNCNSATVRVVIYEKRRQPGARETAFKEIKNKSVKGSWNFGDGGIPAFCGFQGVTHRVEVPVVYIGKGAPDMIYRVLVYPTLRGDAQTAQIGWHHSY